MKISCLIILTYFILGTISSFATNLSAPIKIELESKVSRSMEKELNRLLPVDSKFVVRVNLRGKYVLKDNTTYVELPLGAGKVPLSKVEKEKEFEIRSARIQVFVNQEITTESQGWIKDYLSGHPFVQDYKVRVDILTRLPKNISKNEFVVDQKENIQRKPSSHEEESQNSSSIKAFLKELGFKRISNFEILGLFLVLGSIIIAIGFSIAFYFTRNKSERSHSTSIDKKQTSESPPPIPLKAIDPTLNADQGWNKFTKEGIALALRDIALSSGHKGNLESIINRFLPPELYHLIDTETLFYSSCSETNQVLSPSSKDSSESIKVMIHNVTEYNELAKSEITKTIMKEELIENLSFFRKLTPQEKSLVLVYAPLLLRNFLISSLPLQSRIEISEQKDHIFNHSELPNIKNQLFEKLRNLGSKEITIQNRLNQITNQAIKPISFEEDELLYNLNPAKYEGPLQVLQAPNLIVLKQFNLKDLSKCFYGYSKSIKKQVKTILSPEEQPWFESYCQELENKAMSFTDDEIKAIQMEVSSKLEKVTSAPPHKAA